MSFLGSFSLKYISIELYRDYTIKKQDISFRLLCALRLIALKGTDQSYSQGQWHDVIMGLADQIDDSNERTVYHMLRTLCTRAYTLAEEKRQALNVSATHTHTHLHIFFNLSCLIDIGGCDNPSSSFCPVFPPSDLARDM